MKYWITKYDFGNLKYVNAIHTSSFPDGTYGGQPGGFIIEGEHKTIYIAGDTALTFDMKLIPMQTKLDLAILPIGDNFTMGIESAVIASDFIECNKVLGYHYDTFGYIMIDHDEAQKAFSNEGKNFFPDDVAQIAIRDFVKNADHKTRTNKEIILFWVQEIARKLIF